MMQIQMHAPTYDHCKCSLTVQTGSPGSLAFARWAGWSAGQVGRHVKCWSRSVDL